MTGRIRKFSTKSLKDRSGSVFVYTAIVAPLLLGFAGLSIDVGVWYANTRLAQAAADAGALAGALEVMRNSSATESTVETAVGRDTAANGFTTAKGDTIDVEYPPDSGLYAGAMDSVEVIVSRPAKSFLSQLVFSGTTTINARAVARGVLNDTCVYSLNPDASGALKISGGAQVNLGCGVIANSSDSSALTENGTSCLTSTQIKVVGDYTGDCVSPAPLTGISPISDPLESIQAPAWDPADCDNTNYTAAGGQTLNLTPGTYCGKINATSTGVINFAPGLYVLNNAGLSLGAQTTTTGTDVSFYLTENNGTSENISMSAGATVTLSAPVDGPLPGILFYHDRNSPDNVTHRFTGGSNMHLEGILYFPNQEVQFSGGSSLSSSTSLIIADTVTFTGNTDIGDFENSPVLSNPLLVQAQLVE